MIRKNYIFIIIGIMLFMGITSFLLAWNDSLTFDEVAHIPAGYSYVVLHDYRLNPEHPPLAKILTGLMLLPLHPHFDTTQDFWTETHGTGEYGQWDAGRYLLHHANNDTDKIVFFARMPFIVLALAFGLFLFYWGKRTGGIITGLFALILYAFDPNILGHDHLVTTDLAIAIAMSIAFFYFLQFLKNPTWKNALYGGIALGIAQITKFSAILLIPFFGLLLVIYPLLIILPKEQKRHKIFGSYLLKGIFAMFIMLAVMYATYLPVTYKMPSDVLPTIAAVKGQPNKYPRDKYLIAFINKTNQSTLTRPIATYTQGIMQVFNRVDDGNVSYFMGTVSSNASVWYFPFVFIAKQTLAHLFFYIVALILGLLLIVHSVQRVFTQKFAHSLHACRRFCIRRFHEIALGAFVVFYGYISITGNLTIGFRHLFPIMPLLYILTARTLINSYTKLHNHFWQKIVRGIFVGIILVLATLTISAYPYYISYFNELFGGPKNGFHYVTDSNADWGQDLKRLKKYLDAHPEIDKIRIDYFGGDNVTNRIGDKYIMWWDSKRPIEPGYYAISTLLLQESLYRTDRSYDDTYRWTEKLTPFDHVGTSIILYKVE
ncbi:MAG: glycosyltransferase family 39 protein [Parcubacteria group bacterium]|jgi:hypothetical protein